jgi:hypothetical protein
MGAFYEKVLETIERPSWILRGYAGALVAVSPLARGNFLHVVYREVSRADGFIITAFVTRKINKGMVIWPSRS